MKRYLRKIFIALDILICSFWPWSKSRQTISGYLGSDWDGSVFELGVNKLFYNKYWKLWEDDNHCDDVRDFEKTFIE